MSVTFLALLGDNPGAVHSWGTLEGGAPTYPRTLPSVIETQLGPAGKEGVSFLQILQPGQGHRQQLPRWKEGKKPGIYCMVESASKVPVTHPNGCRA